ncbi:hypothetical protein CR513_16135, partial [Mucuna pruriens]
IYKSGNAIRDACAAIVWQLNAFLLCIHQIRSFSRYEEAMSEAKVEDVKKEEEVFADSPKNEVDSEKSVDDLKDSTNMPSPHEEEEAVKKKYGGMLPKKPPLISKDHERAYFDSADWALGKQGAQKPKGPLEALRPKLQPTQQHARSRRSAYAPADDSEVDSCNNNAPAEQQNVTEDVGGDKSDTAQNQSCLIRVACAKKLEVGVLKQFYILSHYYIKHVCLCGGGDKTRMQLGTWSDGQMCYKEFTRLSLKLISKRTHRSFYFFLAAIVVSWSYSNIFSIGMVWILMKKEVAKLLVFMHHQFSFE